MIDSLVYVFLEGLVNLNKILHTKLYHEETPKNDVVYIDDYLFSLISIESFVNKILHNTKSSFKEMWNGALEACGHAADDEISDAELGKASYRIKKRKEWGERLFMEQASCPSTEADSSSDYFGYFSACGHAADDEISDAELGKKIKASYRIKKRRERLFMERASCPSTEAANCRERVGMTYDPHRTNTK